MCRYPWSAQRRLWSDCVDAQADLSLRWAHMSFCWFWHAAAHMSSVFALNVEQPTARENRTSGWPRQCRYKLMWKVHLRMEISSQYIKTRGPLVLYRSLECWGYVKSSGYWRRLKILNLIELDQGQWMTLTFGTHKASCTHFSWLHLPTFIT